MRRLFALALLLLVPATQAQNDTTPPPDPSSGLPGEQESIERAPGIAYGLLVLVGTLAIGGLLAYVSRRQRPRDRP